MFKLIRSQVNLAIHITCVPILLFTGIALVRSLVPNADLDSTDS